MTLEQLIIKMYEKMSISPLQIDIIVESAQLI